MKNEGYKIYNCDVERLEQQKEFLKNEIIYGNSRECFKVIDLECGTGKTMETEKAMASMVMTTGKKVLFVRERKKDCIESEKRINKMASAFGATVAKAINGDTHTFEQLEDIKYTLYEYPILIITHEKYRKLATSKNKIYFKKGRDILIIDEFLDMRKENELSINKNFINRFETLLKYRPLREQFAKCIKELEDYLLINEGKHCFFNSENDLKTTAKEIDKLKDMVERNFTVEDAKATEYETKKQICNKIIQLKQFYNQTCVVEGNIMYCTDKKPQYWLLNNNIMLDAGAKLNGAYKLNKDLFYVQYQTPTLDHGKWSISVLKINSSKGAKGNALNFYEVINKIIEENNPEETLIMGNKDDEDHICARYKNHFGNVNGSNEYRDLSNVLITHNPNMPYRVYVLEYLYYSNMKLDNRSKWAGRNIGKGIDKVYRFADKRLEKYRNNRNANEIYQAIKRVNRNMEKESNVIIFNNDTETIDSVVKMLKNCDVSIKMDCNFVEYKETKKDKDSIKRKENRQAIRFIRLCKEILEFKHYDLQQQKKKRNGGYEVVNGVYSKKKMREYLGITDKGNFKNEILKDLDVIDFCERHNITGLDSGQTLCFTMFQYVKVAIVHENERILNGSI